MIKVCSDLCGGTVDASPGILRLRVGHGQHQLLDAIVVEGPYIAVLQQFPLAWTQKQVHHEDDEVVEYAEVELRPLWRVIPQVTVGLQ